MADSFGELPALLESKPSVLRGKQEAGAGVRDSGTLRVNIVNYLRARTQGPRGQPACPKTTGSVHAQRQPRGGSEGRGSPGFLGHGRPRRARPGPAARADRDVQRRQVRLWLERADQVCAAVGHGGVPWVPIAESSLPRCAGPAGRARTAVPKHRPTCALAPRALQVTLLTTQPRPPGPLWLLAWSSPPAQRKRGRPARTPRACSRG